MNEQALAKKLRVASRHLRGVDGAVEEFDYVEDLLVGVVNLNAGAKLEEAAGVGGDDDFGAGRGGMMHFVG